MEIVVVLIVVAVLGAVAFSVMRERGPVGATLPRRALMPSMVSEHARATDPAATVASERRHRAQARDIAVGLQGGRFAQPAPYGAPVPIDDEGAIVISGSPLAEDPHALEARWRAARDADPMDDPRYADPRYNGRLAGDWLGLGRDGRGR
jgi:hypothetical protein